MIASDTGRYETRRLLDEHAEALRRALETARVAAIASEESALTELSRQCASEQAPVRPVRACMCSPRRRVASPQVRVRAGRGTIRAASEPGARHDGARGDRDARGEGGRQGRGCQGAREDGTGGARHDACGFFECLRLPLSAFECL